MPEIVLIYKIRGYGPYTKKFYDQNEALIWVKENDVELISIDMI